ncbi:MAG: hypothetical protein GWM98_04820 [Nitrospinaceae bacterium]|nr:hypothetical protein [Deltaproteobacteria bacterium]NIY14243.1 hypothetical protein [Nitrospinaceae bacterium]
MELRELLTPGKKIRIFINEGNPNNCTQHIRAIVDEDQIVYKVYSRNRQFSRYFVEHIGHFENMHKNGWLSRAK